MSVCVLSFCYWTSFDHSLLAVLGVYLPTDRSYLFACPMRLTHIYLHVFAVTAKDKILSLKHITTAVFSISMLGSYLTPKSLFRAMNSKSLYCVQIWSGVPLPYVPVKR